MESVDYIDLNGADDHEGLPEHNSNISSPKCPKCEETFTFRYQLEWHYKWKHSLEGPPLFICTQCNKSCLSEFDAHWHRIKHGRQSFHVCEKCNMRFQTDLELRQHHLVHRKPHTIGFSCSKCEKTFTDRFSLQRHGELHSEAPAHPQNCLGCFSRKSFRVKHQKTRFSNCCHKACADERICAHGFYRTL